MKQLPRLSKRRIFIYSVFTVLAVQTIAYLSNILMLWHTGESFTAYRLFDISFYYFIPIISWAMAALVLLYMVRQLKAKTIPASRSWVWFISLLIFMSFFMRTLDILIDFSVKYLIGMIQISPFTVLNDVWLVIFATAPVNLILLTALSFIYYLILPKSNRETSTITINDKGKLSMIPTTHIIYLKSDGNYIKVFTPSSEFKTRETLKAISARLDDRFVKVHRSTIINRNKLKFWKHWRNGEYLMQMTNGHTVTSSRTYNSAVQSLKQFVTE